MSLKLTDNEINSLLDEVVLDLNKSFTEVKERLAKAEDKKEESKEESKEMEKAAPPMKEESSPGQPGTEESSPIPSGESPAPEASSPPAETEPADSNPEMDPAQEMGGELTPEALQAEYEKLPPEELQMHLQACQAALAKLAPPAEMAPVAAPEAQPEMAPPAPAMKSDSTVSDLAKAEIDSLKEDIEILTKTVKTLVETPVRKAITSMDELSKEEVQQVSHLSPNDFWSKLSEVAKRQDLKKSERQLIKDIYDRRVKPEVAAQHLAKLFED